MKYLILIPIIPKLCCCFSIEQEKKKNLYCIVRALMQLYFLMVDMEAIIFFGVW